MNGIPSFVVMTIIMTLLIILISILFVKNGKLLAPLATLALSILLFVASIFIGSWTGMGLGLFSLSLFIASLISLILLTFYEAFKIKSMS